MATYKVIQDIEAEDKLLGPLTLRQFIYGAVAGLAGYFCFVGVAKHLYPLTVIFLPVFILFAFFAFPWGRDQPTEVWALAKVRFLLLPRRRLWDQSGAKELVTVTAPKRVDNNYTDNLSQTEVKSRLKALADTIDSRGWVIKNVDPAAAASLQAAAPQSDRLVDIASLPQEVSSVNMQPDEDVMDDNSQTATNFDQMINTSEARHRQQLMQAAAGKTPQPTSQAAAPPDNFWFLNQPAGAAPTPLDSSVIAPGSDDDNSVSDDAALAEQLKANKKTPEVYSSHLRNIHPLSDQPQPQTDLSVDPADSQAQTDTDTPEPPVDTKADDNRTTDAKMELDRLARNNDLSVAALARQADKQSDNEVVISLH